MTAWTEPFLHIVVVTRDCAGAFTAFWLHLAAQRCREWRLIVIDNGSSDRTVPVLRALADDRVTVIENPADAGHAEAVNAGLRLAVEQGAQRCLLLDPHLTPQPGFVEDLLGWWLEYEWDAVAPKVMRGDAAWYAGGWVEVELGANVSGVRVWLNDDRPDAPLTPQRMSFAPLGCLGLSVRALDRVGLLDVRLPARWLAADYCLRLADARIPVWYVPEAVLTGDLAPDPITQDHAGHAALLRKRVGWRAALGMAGRLAWADGGLRAGAAMLRGLRAAPEPEQRVPAMGYSARLPPGGYSARLPPRGYSTRPR